MSKQSKFYVLLGLSLALVVLVYLVFFGKEKELDQDNTLINPQIIFEEEQAFLVAQLRNSSNAPYRNLQLRVNILAAKRTVIAQAQAKTDAVLPGITWFLKAPLVLSPGESVGASALGCKAAAPFKEGERLVVNCRASTKSY